MGKSSSLGLQGDAKQAAEDLEEKFPKIIFTSGRRDLKEQARAMAGNIVKDKTYLKSTYKPSKAKDACLKWCDENPKKSSKEVEVGLYDTLKGFSAGDQQKISRHLGGLAFDVKPNCIPLKDLKETVKKYGGEFLDHEGKLCRWHAQFKK